jgi:hypothetical protein
VCGVKGFQHLEVPESLLQGVHARVFLEDAEPWESSKGFEPLKESKERIATSNHRRMGSQRKNGRSEFSEEKP